MKILLIAFLLFGTYAHAEFYDSNDNTFQELLALEQLMERKEKREKKFQHKPKFDKDVFLKDFYKKQAYLNQQKHALFKSCLERHGLIRLVDKCGVESSHLPAATKPAPKPHYWL